MTAPSSIVAPDAFLGRARELERLGQALAAAPVVTVTGPAGVGKPAWPAATSRSWLRTRPVFCDLSEAHAEVDLAIAVASVLGVSLEAVADPVTRVGWALAGRPGALVVLDNLEQLAPGIAAGVIATWLRMAPSARFLVTSREPLGGDAERLLPLPPLLDADALALFEARAVFARRGRSLSPGHREAAAALVRDLEGLPLAIELAAARTALLSPAEIRDRIATSFALLADPDGARHDTGACGQRSPGPGGSCPRPRAARSPSARSFAAASRSRRPRP